MCDMLYNECIYNTLLVKVTELEINYSEQLAMGSGGQMDKVYVDCLVHSSQPGHCPQY